MEWDPELLATLRKLRRKFLKKKKKKKKKKTRAVDERNELHHRELPTQR